MIIMTNNIIIYNNKINKTIQFSYNNKWWKKNEKTNYQNNINNNSRAMGWELTFVKFLTSTDKMRLIWLFIQ